MKSRLNFTNVCLLTKMFAIGLFSSNYLKMSDLSFISIKLCESSSNCAVTSALFLKQRFYISPSKFEKFSMLSCISTKSCKIPANSTGINVPFLKRNFYVFPFLLKLRKIIRSKVHSCQITWKL